jgi:hypothetical protein
VKFKTSLRLSSLPSRPRSARKITSHPHARHEPRRYQSKSTERITRVPRPNSQLTGHRERTGYLQLLPINQISCCPSLHISHFQDRASLISVSEHQHHGLSIEGRPRRSLNHCVLARLSDRFAHHWLLAPRRETLKLGFWDFFHAERSSGSA